MRKMWRALFACAIVSAGAIFAVWLYGAGIFEKQISNSLERNNICFEKNYPGATSRFVQFTPVHCDKKEVKISEAYGADYAELHYEDIDNDGFPEVIIESSKFRCKFGAGPCYDAYRIVLKVTAGSNPSVQLVERTYLSELVENPR